MMRYTSHLIQAHLFALPKFVERNLLGGEMLSFYDWYADLPPASPQIWGEQTDVPESIEHLLHN
jgi:nitrate reductase alpha subunit